MATGNKKRHATLWELTLVLILALCMLGVVMLSTSTSRSTTASTSHAAERLHRVTGQFVENVTRDDSCQPGSLGVNGVGLTITGLNTRFNRSTTTITGGSGQNGAFYFNNVPDGKYRVCVNNIPFTTVMNLCSVPSGATVSNPCFSVNVNGADASYNRFSYVCVGRACPHVCIGRGCP